MKRIYKSAFRRIIQAAIYPEIIGRHMADCLLGSTISWTVDNAGQIRDVNLPPPLSDNLDQSIAIARRNRITRIVQTVKHPLSGSRFRRMLADRDIQPEQENEELSLASNGQGSTNIIRRYIVSASSRFPRELIQKELLSALNEIFGSDGSFTEIEVKVHDEQNTDSPYKHWEVHLGEKQKGLVSLSRSGSGLKTVLLVLLNLLVIPHWEEIKKSKYVFAFEELENNLHPALLRRLLLYLEAYADREKATLFLTTHSSVALDIFGMSKNAQIIHITHDGEAARAEPVAAHFDHLGVISELGAKPSDLLQATALFG
jgi:putative ATP-dependent endonuclease of the OLD family